MNIKNDDYTNPENNFDQKEIENEKQIDKNTSLEKQDLFISVLLAARLIQGNVCFESTCLGHRGSK